MVDCLHVGTLPAGIKKQLMGSELTEVSEVPSMHYSVCCPSLPKIWQPCGTRHTACRPVQPCHLQLMQDATCAETAGSQSALASDVTVLELSSGAVTLSAAAVAELLEDLAETSKSHCCS